jgi:hypothetical protein
MSEILDLEFSSASGQICLAKGVDMSGLVGQKKTWKL